MHIAVGSQERSAHNPESGATAQRPRLWQEWATDTGVAQKQAALTALLRLSNGIRHYGPARTERFLALDCRVPGSLVLNL